MRYHYDLHLHSCLSPCGDRDNTPCNIVNMAALLGYDIIAVTDHNTTRNCQAACRAGEAAGITVIPGTELCTAEEIHVVCLFPTLADAAAFQKKLDKHRLPIKNKPAIYGEQLILDENDCVIGEERDLLLNASTYSIDEVPKLIESFHGVAFPAHIDRPAYSIVSSLGDIPPLGFTAMEISASGDVDALCRQFPQIRRLPLLLDSDAHYLSMMPDPCAWMELPDASAETVIAALRGTIPAGFGRSAETQPV